MTDRHSLLAAFVLGVVLTGCDASRAGGPPAAPPPVVKAETVTEQDVPISAEWVGTLVGSINAQIRPRVSGHLVSQNYKEGALVKIGDLLFQVDPRPYQVQLTQAEGQMARDQALLKNAQIDLERYQTLLAQDSISKQQVDTQEALVRQYQGAVQSDQGAIDNARLQLTYSRVTAPISGRVGLRLRGAWSSGPWPAVQPDAEGGRTDPGTAPEAGAGTGEGPAGGG